LQGTVLLNKLVAHQAAELTAFWKFALLGSGGVCAAAKSSEVPTVDWQNEADRLLEILVDNYVPSPPQQFYRGGKVGVVVRVMSVAVATSVPVT